MNKPVYLIKSQGVEIVITDDGKVFCDKDLSVLKFKEGKEDGWSTLKSTEVVQEKKKYFQ